MEIGAENRVFFLAGPSDYLSWLQVERLVVERSACRLSVFVRIHRLDGPLWRRQGPGGRRSIFICQDHLNIGILRALGGSAVVVARLNYNRAIRIRCYNLTKFLSARRIGGAKIFTVAYLRRFLIDLRTLVRLTGLLL